MGACQRGWGACQRDGFSWRRCASIIGFSDNDGIGFWKSVDTWLTREGEFGERKIPNSLIIRVRDLELWYSRRGSNPGHPD